MRKGVALQKVIFGILALIAVLALALLVYNWQQAAQETQEGVIEEDNIRKLRQACDDRRNRICKSKAVDYFLQKRFDGEADAMKKWAEKAEIKTTAGTKNCKELSENKFKEAVPPCSESKVQGLKSCVKSLENFFCEENRQVDQWVKYIDGYNIAQSCSDYVDKLKEKFKGKSVSSVVCKDEGGGAGEDEGTGEDEDTGSVYNVDWEITYFNAGSSGGVVNEDGEINMKFNIINSGDSESSYNVFVLDDSGKRKNLIDSMTVGAGESKTSSMVTTDISTLKDMGQWCDMHLQLDQDDGPSYRTKDVVTEDKIKEWVVPSCEGPRKLLYFSNKESCAEEGFEEGINLFGFSSAGEAVVWGDEEIWGQTANSAEVNKYDRMYLCMNPLLQTSGGNRIYTEVSEAGSSENALIQADNPCENGNELLRFANWDWDGNKAWFGSNVDGDFANTDDIVHLCYRDRGFRYKFGDMIQFHETEYAERGSCKNGWSNNGAFTLNSGGSGKNYFAYITEGPDKGEKLMFDRDHANLCLYPGTYSNIED